jgi:hypothetical protein
MEGVKELEATGWLTVERVTGGDPSVAKGYVTNSFRFAFERASGDSTPGDEFDTGGSVENDTGGSVGSNTPGVSETTPPRSVENDTQTLELDQQGKKPGKTNRARASSRSSQVGDAAFDEFWQAYPKEVGEKAAREAYQRVLKKGSATAPELHAGASRYALEVDGREQQFIAQAANWLRDERWRDAPNRPGHTPRTNQPHSATERAMEAMLHRSGYFEEQKP